MDWLTNEELQAVKACREEELLPAVLEFLSLSKQLRDQAARDRAGELLAAFRATEPRECPDVWYGQLEHVHTVAKLLGDAAAQQHALAVNDAVRDASRQSVRLVASAEHRKRVREEAKAMEERWPAGRAEVTRPTRGIHAPACDVAEVFSQGGAVLCQRAKDAGYMLESKQLGRQGAIPTPAKLAAIKERCIAELVKAQGFVSFVGKTTGVDVVTQFTLTIHQAFSIDLFCARGGPDGISVSDLFTQLPMVLELRQQQSDDLLRELQARFMAFRIDLSTMCNPLEQYMPIFEAIFEQFRCVNEDLLREHGDTTLAMFRALFSSVLDLLAGSVETLSRALGAGLGITVGAAGAVAAEGTVAVKAWGVPPLTALIGGAVVCVLAVRGLVYLVDLWIRHGNHVRVSAVLRRTEDGIWRVWIIELLQ